MSDIVDCVDLPAGTAAYAFIVGGGLRFFSLLTGESPPQPLGYPGLDVAAHWAGFLFHNGLDWDAATHAGVNLDRRLSDVRF